MQDTLFGEAAPEVRVLTVKRPWAFALIYLGKDVENRSKYVGYRGTLLIHAGQELDKAGVEFLRSIGVELPAEAYRAGHIVGSVEVTGCVTGSRSQWARPDRYHVQVSDPRPATQQVTLRGNLGLQMPPADWERAFA